MTIFTQKTIVKIFAIRLIVQGAVLTQGPKRHFDMFGCLPKHNDVAAQLAGVAIRERYLFDRPLGVLNGHPEDDNVYLFWIFQCLGKLMSGQALDVLFERNNVQDRHGCLHLGDDPDEDEQ